VIICRTPFRVSLFGGGTDFPAWYLSHGGAVLGTTINKYCYLTVRTLPPFFEHKHRVVYSRIELVQKISEIQHPSVRAVMGEMAINEGLEIHHDGDLPARSGLGSSSSFTVGLLNVLSAYRGHMISAKALAQEAIRIEQDVIGEAVGSQDQIWAAHGGLSRINFSQDGTFDVHPIVIEPERRKLLNSHMMLFFTGFSRIAAEIEKEKIANVDKRKTQLRALGAMVDEGTQILQNRNGDISEIGELLNEAWRLKKEMSDKVTTAAIDEIYEAALDAGAMGGKLLGAGGGGFLLLFVAPEKHASVRKRLGSLTHVSIEIGSPGSRIVVYEPEEQETF
jgi:D-glycero-alpha-D-manno-heptose-7-phosphate kinase